MPDGYVRTATISLGISILHIVQTPIALRMYIHRTLISSGRRAPCTTSDILARHRAILRPHAQAHCRIWRIAIARSTTTRCAAPGGIYRNTLGRGFVFQDSCDWSSGTHSHSHRSTILYPLAALKLIWLDWARPLLSTCLRQDLRKHTWSHATC